MADTYAKNYKYLRHGAKSSGVKIRIKEKHGLFMFLRRYKGRFGILAGTAAAIILLVFCQSRIWKIEISGCGDELKNAVKYQLFENGVNTGCDKNKIDPKELSRLRVINDDRIAWIAINIVGSTAFVEVSERQPPPEAIDPDNRIANLVAACDGQIKYLEIYEGQTLVKVGEAVSRGDILVSGIMEDQYGKKQLKFSRGKVIARVNEQVKISVPLKQSVWQQTGKEKTRCFISVGEKLVPIWGFKNVSGAYSVSENRQKVIFFDIVTRKYAPQQLVTTEIDEKIAKEYAMSQLDKQDITGEEKIISRSRKAELLNGVLTVTENRVVEKDIAVSKEIEWIGREAA